MHTLSDMIQVGQWYGKHQVCIFILYFAFTHRLYQSKDKPTQKSGYRPAVKFRDVEASLLEAVQLRDAERERERQEGAESDGPESEDEDGGGEGAAGFVGVEDAENSDTADRDREPDNEPAASSRRKKAKPPPEAAQFIIDGDIDIDSPAQGSRVS